MGAHVVLAKCNTGMQHACLHTTLLCRNGLNKTQLHGLGVFQHTEHTSILEKRRIIRVVECTLSSNWQQCTV